MLHQRHILSLLFCDCVQYVHRATVCKNRRLRLDRLLDYSFELDMWKTVHDYVLTKCRNESTSSVYNTIRFVSTRVASIGIPKLQA